MESWLVCHLVAKNRNGCNSPKGGNKGPCFCGRNKMVSNVFVPHAIPMPIQLIHVDESLARDTIYRPVTARREHHDFHEMSGEV